MMDYSDGDADVEMGEPPKPVVVKTEGEDRGHKKAPLSVNNRQDSPDLFSAPQHFTANAKTRKRKNLKILRKKRRNQPKRKRTRTETSPKRIRRKKRRRRIK